MDSEELVAKTYGWERVIYSLARVSVVMNGNQVNFDPRNSVIEYGEKTNETLSERVEAVKGLFDRAGITSSIRKDMEKAIWFRQETSHPRDPGAGGEE